MEAGWDDLVHDLAIDLAGLQDRQFVVVEYNAGIDPNPYAQARPESDGGWYCEVVSAHFLPEEIWTLDAGFLASDGWQAPEGDQDNWSRAVSSAEESARALAEALRRGRGCRDWRAVTWWIGRWGPPPDDGREPTPVTPRGWFGLAA